MATEELLQKPDLNLVIAELLAATEPTNRPPFASLMDGTAVLEYDWQRLANLGFTSPPVARQVRSFLQMAQHLIDGDISPEGVAPSIIAVGKLLARDLEPVAQIEAGI